MKVDASYIVGSLAKVSIFLKRFVPFEGYFNLSYKATLKPQRIFFINMCLHSSFCQADKLEEWTRAKNVFEQLLYVPLVYVVSYFKTTVRLSNTFVALYSKITQLCSNCPILQ